MSNNNFFYNAQGERIPFTDLLLPSNDENDGYNR
jgi:hypothetical protein